MRGLVELSINQLGCPLAQGFWYPHAGFSQCCAVLCAEGQACDVLWCDQRTVAQ